MRAALYLIGGHSNFMTGSQPKNTPKPAATGSQTLARGLRALELVSLAPDGLSVQAIAKDLGVHRTIAYRLLATLVQFRLVARDADGLYRPAAGIAVLGASYGRNLRQICMPVLRELAEGLRTTVSLLVAEGDEQVAVAVIVPANVSYQLSFHEGSRYPIDRGAAGVMLRASRPPEPGEREGVAQARERGWAMTHGEVEPDIYGLAIPVRQPDTLPPLCINLISHRREIVEQGREAAQQAAERLSAILS